MNLKTQGLLRGLPAIRSTIRSSVPCPADRRGNAALASVVTDGDVDEGVGRPAHREPRGDGELGADAQGPQIADVE